MMIVPNYKLFAIFSEYSSFTALLLFFKIAIDNFGCTILKKELRIIASVPEIASEIEYIPVWLKSR